MKKKQCPVKQTNKRQVLAELFALEAAGFIELYFGGVSGFWQTPVVAHAWQFRGEEIRITQEKGKRLSVIGFLNEANQAKLWISEKSINAQFIVDFIDQWVSEKLSRPRVLIMDNAKVNRARLAQEKIARWEAKNLYVFYLPTYSPHLNLIETLWRKMKYEWLKPEDYVSFEKLTEAIKKILSEIGKEHKLNLRTEYL